MKTTIVIFAVICAFVAIGLSYFMIYQSWSKSYEAEYRRLELNKSWIENSVYTRIEIEKLNKTMDEVQKSLIKRK